MIDNEFYGLIGVFGESAERILKDILITNEISASDLVTFTNASFYVSHNPILKYPPYIGSEEKGLVLFGNCFLNDVTLSEFLRSPKQHLMRTIEENGQMIPQKFVNGAYIGVILDRGNYSVFNDFFGLQPLYYYRDKSHVMVSTRLRVLARFVNPELDKETLSEYLSLQSILSGRTIIKGVQSLPPSSTMNINAGVQIKIDNYITYPPDELISSSIGDIAEDVGNAFKKSIRQLYSENLKYCMTLTGGSDTRLIFLEWPDREKLLTETAGYPDSSDVLKAKELMERYGNPKHHVLEDMHTDKYFDGFQKYYDLSDNPLNVKNYNYYHLQSKFFSRSPEIYMYGAGELLAGENLYLSRSPSYLLKEMFLPYKYHKLENSDKPSLLKEVLKVKYKHVLEGILRKDLQTSVDLDEVLMSLGPYLGEAKFQETLTERFRTTAVALQNYATFGEVLDGTPILISPYYNRELVETILKYHPSYRELRRLHVYILRKYHGYDDIPLDTTHLRIRTPYYFHKLARVPRFVLNIGLHRKVPIIQKGNPPSYRRNPYLEPGNTDFRAFVHETIRKAEVFDSERLDELFKKTDSVKEFTFYSHHRELTNIFLMFRAAYAVKKFNLYT